MVKSLMDPHDDVETMGSDRQPRHDDGAGRVCAALPSLDHAPKNNPDRSGSLYAVGDPVAPKNSESSVPHPVHSVNPADLHRLHTPRLMSRASGQRLSASSRPWSLYACQRRSAVTESTTIATREPAMNVG